MNDFESKIYGEYLKRESEYKNFEEFLFKKLERYEKALKIIAEETSCDIRL
jgi:hypothetical protein